MPMRNYGVLKSAGKGASIISIIKIKIIYSDGQYLQAKLLIEF